jgi:hypothetical protein
MAGILSSFVYSKGGISAMMEKAFQYVELSSFEFDKACRRGKEELPKLSMATRSFKVGEIGIKDRQGDGQLRRLYRLSPANFTRHSQIKEIKDASVFTTHEVKPRNIPIWGKRGLSDT